MSNESTRLLERLAATHAAFSPDVLPADSMEELWSRLGARPPRVFDDLVRLYCWSDDTRLDVVILYPRERGSIVGWEAALRHDAGLSSRLLRAGFLPFGRLDTGSYDPVCFDTSRVRANDCPIVRIDHEAVLLRDSCEISAELHSSTRKWMERCAQ